MKLYQIPSGSKILCEGKEITFHHTDGMYSYCTDINDNVIHLAVWTSLKKNETGGYVIDNDHQDD